MSNICIIPARGGSKRIPKKNIKLFFEKPIIAYAIEAAVQSQLFDVVMVSTDDAEIQIISQQYGASVPFLRSEENSNDYAITIDVLNEVIAKYKSEGKEFINLCCLYPCTPLLNANILQKSYEILNTEGVSSVIPIVPFSFPIQRAFKKEGNFINFLQPEYEKTRSQDLEKAYHDSGQFYWIKVEEMLLHKSLLTPHTAYFEMNELDVQDIDNISDWVLAELKYQLKFNNRIIQ